MDEVIEPLAAHGEGAHGKTVHKALLGVVHRAALNEIHHGLGKHFRVDSQMPLAPQLICYAFGMLPIPSWMVEPSSTREATKAPIFLSTSV